MADIALGVGSYGIARTQLKQTQISEIMQLKRDLIEANAKATDYNQQAGVYKNRGDKNGYDSLMRMADGQTKRANEIATEIHELESYNDLAAGDVATGEEAVIKGMKGDVKNAKSRIEDDDDCCGCIIL